MAYSIELKTMLVDTETLDAVLSEVKERFICGDYVPNKFNGLYHGGLNKGYAIGNFKITERTKQND